MLEQLGPVEYVIATTDRHKTNVHLTSIYSKIYERDTPVLAVQYSVCDFVDVSDSVESEVQAGI